VALALKVTPIQYKLPSCEYQNEYLCTAWAGFHLCQEPVEYCSTVNAISYPVDIADVFHGIKGDLGVISSRSM
jgi:hypothetical protein